MSGDSTQRGTSTSTAQFRTDAGQTPRQIADALVAQWRSGRKADAYAAFQKHPELLADKSCLLDLALEEYCHRRDAGEELGPLSFRERFESLGFELAHSIERLVEVEELAQRSEATRPEFAWPSHGDTINGFAVLEEIGRGGLGRAYLCREEAVGERQVVVKVTAGPAVDAQWLGRLTHAAIVPVYSVSSFADGQATLTCMPFVGRTTLRHVIDGASDRRSMVHTRSTTDGADGAAYSISAPPLHDPVEPPHLRRRLGLLGDLAGALGYIHDRGVVHGDVKPSNVLVTERGAMLIDFNLAGPRSPDHPIIGGTFPYLPPEDLQRVISPSVARPNQERSTADVYAFGITAAELLGGATPNAPGHCSTRTPEWAAAVTRSQIQCVEAAAANPTVPKPLGELLHACLSADPVDRPPAELLASAFRRAEHRLANRPRVRRRLAIGLAAATIAGSVMSYGIHSNRPLQRYRRGIAALKEGDYQTAVDEFSGVINALGDSPAARYSRAWALMLSGSPSVAMDDLRRVSSSLADDYAYASVGYCFAIQGNYTAGTPWYERVDSELRDTREVLNNLGCCLWLGRSPRSLEDQIGAAHSCLIRAAEHDADGACLANLLLFETTRLNGSATKSDVERAERTAKDAMTKSDSETVRSASVLLLNAAMDWSDHLAGVSKQREPSHARRPSVVLIRHSTVHPSASI